MTLRNRRMTLKTILFIVAVLILVSCDKPKDGEDGINGNNGSVGVTGSNGQDGLSLVVNVQTLVTIDGTVCKQTDIFQDIDRNSVYSPDDNYQNGFLVCNGAIGAKGDDGENGMDGIDGQDGSSGQDGIDGVNGTDGQDGLDADITYQVVEIIDPCGQQHPNGYDEVILKLGNGKYLASFSDNANGKNTRLGILSSGNYVTTDDTDCHFTIP